MNESPVAGNYAATLFELAERDDAAESYGALLDEFVGAYQELEELRAFLDTPRVPLGEKQEAVRASLEGRAPETFIRFLLVVLEKGRQRALPSIARAYADRLDRKAGTVRASITLPYAADDALKSSIVGVIEQTTGQSVEAEFRSDPELIGGMVVQVGDRLLDASLKRQLEKLKWELI